MHNNISYMPLHVYGISSRSGFVLVWFSSVSKHMYMYSSCESTFMKFPVHWNVL